MFLKFVPSNSMILTSVLCHPAFLLDPEIIVFGGPNDGNLDFLNQAIHDNLGTNLLRLVHIVPSELGKDAVILGSAYSAPDHLPIMIR